jgi:hypothetical protein
MAAKDEAKRKVAAAERASALIFQGMGKAVEILRTDVHFNGLGVIGDPYAVRRQLELAESAIQAAKSLLASVDWPTDADYDHF